MSNFLGLGENATTNEAEIDLHLESTAKSGAHWFYWIAGLSLVNSLAFTAGLELHFLAGLGLTELANAVISPIILQGGPAILRGFSLVFNIILITGFGLAGYYASRLIGSAFLVGIVVYLFDGLLVLLLGDFFMAGFHAFALFFIVRGYLACRKINSHFLADNRLAETGPPPPPIF